MSPATIAGALAITILFTSGAAAAAPAAPAPAPAASAPSPDAPKGTGVFPLTAETALVIRGVPGQLVVTSKPARELRYSSRAKDKIGSQRPLVVSVSGTTVTLSPPPGVTLPDGILRLEAPESLAVRVEAQEGTLLVDGFAGAVTIVGTRTVVRAQALTGPLTAELEGGSLTLTNLAGPVTAKIRAACALTATNVRGAFDLNSQDATFKVQTVGGACRIEARGGTGELTGLASGGDLHFSDSALRLSGGKGDVTINSNAAVIASAMVGAMRFEMEGGSVRAQDLKGPVNVRARRTEISLESITGDVNVDNTRGNVVLQRISGPVTAVVFAGDAKLLELQGPLRLDMDGGTAAVTWTSIGADQDSQLQNKGGDISVRFPGNTACHVSAKSKSGRITSEVPAIKTTADGTSADGVLGPAGKPLISIEADGNIHLSGGAGGPPPA